LIAATPPPVQQKKLLASTAFFASLGVLVEPHNSIAVGLCSFFWKIAKENPIKKQHLINGNLPKKSSAQVKTISRLKANSKVSFVLAFG
jgi:hypothetical protein